MEGLIPFVYRAIVQYKNGGEGLVGSWLNESSPSTSPSYSYMRLPASDSGRFQDPDVELFQSDCCFSASSSSSPPSGTQISVSTAVRSPVVRRMTTPRRVVA